MPADKASQSKALQGATGWLTRSVNKCTEFANTEISLVTKAEYESLIAEYNKRLEAWDDAQKTLEDITDAEQLDALIDTSGETREKAEHAKIAAMNHWSKAAESKGIVANKPPASTSGEHSLKLPKLELAKFNGEILKFYSFWEQFEACIDSQEGVPNITKFNYLLSLLKGDAKRVLDGLSVTGANYETAKSILLKRYGKKELVIFAHIQALLQLDVGSNSSDLSLFYDKLIANVRGLQGLGITSNQYGVILTPIIVSRLSQELRDDWAKDSEGKESDMDHLVKFLDSELARRERSQSVNVVHLREESVRTDTSRSRVKPAATALHTASSRTNVRKCEFCDKSNHKSEKCFKYAKLTCEKRKKLVSSKGLCFRCLSKSHMAKSCTERCSVCDKPTHHSSLCYEAESSRQDNVDEGGSAEGGASRSAVNTVSSNVSNVGANISFSLLPVARVKVKGADGWFVATLMFDSGSDKSYVSQSLVQKVRPRWLRMTEVSFSTFGGRSHGSRSKVFSMALRGEHSSTNVDIELTEVPVICLPLAKPVVDSKLLEEFEQLELAYDFSSSDGLNIDILIGQDLFWSLMSGKVHKGEKSGIVAQESIFGWVLSGSSGSQGKSGVSMLNVCTIPDNIVKSFWDLESIGVTDKDSEVDSVLQDFNQDIEYNESSGRYKVGLTWKKTHPDLVDNKSIAISSLNRLEKRLEGKEDLKERYNKALEEMEHLGFIKEVENEGQLESPVFYLPHHPHIKEESLSTKIRPVFNGSCKGPNGVSLNDCLETGPNLNPGVVDIVLRFRRWKYAVSADVRKAFLMIEMKDRDQDVQRFLWRNNGRIRIMKFVRVTFGIKCSSFLLSATVLHHLSQCPPSFVVKELGENLYVDDFLSGADSKEDVKVLFEEANKVMSKAGLELAKWTSNESSLLGGDLDSSGDSTAYVKVLGVTWDSEADVFTFSAADLPKPVHCSKRVVLSLLARVFDPLGFILPFTVNARFLFQDVWRLGLGWDDSLTEDLKVEFSKWLKGIKVLEGVSIPRQYFEDGWLGTQSSIEVHAFGDASLKGYGACVYIRARMSSGQYKVMLVRACARVAPLERKTLPRLELLGCLVTAKLVQSVLKALHFSEDVSYTCWTDSMVALGWLKGLPTKWKPWVANRVSSIQGLTSPDRWRHVSGIENPADLVTRGLPADKLLESDLWWYGPQFLRQPEIVVDQPLPVDIGQFPEVQSECKKVANVLVTVNSTCIFEFERWSTLEKAYKVIGWVLRFVKKARKLQVSSGPDLVVEDLSAAKEVFVKVLQARFFNVEIQSLKEGKSVSRSSKLSKLSPFLDQAGVLRIKGRLQLSELAFESKHPVILPKCHGSYLLVHYVHRKQHHAGVDAMITFVRQSFEVFGLRVMAKSVKKACVSCQKCDARACNEVPAPLPKVRVTKAPVFSVTGIDFAGPVFCIDCPEKKLYICLFVCGVVRAIHLELVDNLTSEDFLFSFRRFCALKRVPSIVYSDNGKNFIGGERVLGSYLDIEAPEWRFICPRSPWWGGWWERLVRSVKNAIRKTLGKRSLTKVELTTCLHEVASSINSRPLTFVGTSVENRTPLTPNHFLSGQGNQGLESNLIEDPENLDVDSLSLRHQEMVFRQEDFWKVWSTEYIRNLPPAFQKFKKEGNVEVGSVVMVREDNMPRSKWCIGVVKRLHLGKDDIPRSADIKTSSGLKTRAIQRLYNLEVSHSSVDVNEDSVVNTSGDNLSESVVEPEVPVAGASAGVVDEADGVEVSSVRSRRRRVPKRYDDFLMYD